ncbi:hypothetical protein [Paenarthrobacter sp.]|uniref:hypothetical protein n=1 Tax=Paenarthrobacter sp. TaxID=1931993 RepID=UPI0028115270|nr:hypothetical protein [Paenarthrobacter sp.]
MLGRGLDVGVAVSVGVGVGVGVGVTVGVGEVVGVGVVGGVVTVSDGTSLGAGEGWVGAGLVTPGTAGTEEGTADGTQTGSARDTFGVGVDDDDPAVGASANVAGWPASEDAVATDEADGDADGAEALEYEALGAGDAEPEFLSPALASCAGVSWPKNGSSRACPKVPAVSTSPSAPATTAMRWLMCLTDAAFRRAACGSRPNEDVDPKLDLAAEGAAAWVRTSLRLANAADAVAAAATCAGDLPRGDSARGNPAASVVFVDSSRADTTGMAVVVGSGAEGWTTGMAAVAGSWARNSCESGSKPAEGALAGVTMGIAAVGGPGVVDLRAAVSTVGIAAVAGSACSDGSGVDCDADASGAITARAARSRSAARISARVAGAATAGMAAVAGSGVVPVLVRPASSGFVGAAAESAGAPVGNPLGWARRRPVGLVRSPSMWARRG